MRSRLLFHLGPLAAGTTLSVAVALSCAVRSDLRSEVGSRQRDATFEWFEEHAPAAYRSEELALLQVRGFGVEAAELFDVPCFGGPASFGHRLRCGWPLHSFESSWWGRLPILLPPEPRRAAELFPKHLGTLRPIWPGVIANAVLFSGLLCLLAEALACSRRRFRARRGRCPSCSYPRGLSSVCTECGTPVGMRVA